MAAVEDGALGTAWVVSLISGLAERGEMERKRCEVLEAGCCLQRAKARGTKGEYCRTRSSCRRSYVLTQCNAPPFAFSRFLSH